MRVAPPPLPWTGGCQCGAVRYEVTAAPLTLYACHCTRCQKQSGAAFGLSMLVPSAAVVRHGAVRLAERAPDDRVQSERAFCPACGTRLWHRRPGTGVTSLKPGTLDDTSWLRPVGHMWASSAQAWSRPPPGPLTYDRQPVGYDALIAAWTAATA